MSINITVAKNQFGGQRRTVLSDLEQLKKSERERRKRLRLEQVRHQSKERTNEILGRAKLIERDELERLKNDEDSELRLLHNHKLESLQQQYRDNMENIGQAHISAARQPDVDQVLKIAQHRNRMTAAERGREATRRLKETNKKRERERCTTKNRLKNIRESENVRAAMISQLSKMSSNYDDRISSGPSETDDNIALPKQKTMKGVSATVHHHQREDDSECLPQRSSHSRRSEGSKHVVVDAINVPRTVISCESDDQEPRRTVPIINISLSKADRIASYNPEDYRQPTSEENTSVYSSNSLDSSQSTSGNRETVVSNKTAKVHTTPVSNQVHMYDLSTRREDQYIMPSRVVEKINLRTEPRAEDQARDIIRTESYFSQLSELRKVAAQNRGRDALLRESVRRDYDQLLRKLDQYQSDERKLKATMTPKAPDLHMHPARKKQQLRKRQQQMERELENIMRTKRPTNVNFNEPISERIITTQRHPQTSHELAANSETDQSPNKVLHYEQILQMLMRLERTKYQLWVEYGTSLPESISSVTQRPLGQVDQLNASLIVTDDKREKEGERKNKSAEIRVINVSLENEKKKKKTKRKEKEKEKGIELMETAVQTSIDKGKAESEDAKDKSVQVEMSKELNEIVRTEQQQPQVLEPTVKIIAETANVDSGSSVSSASTDIVIDVDARQLKVSPKTKSKRPKLSVVTRKYGRSTKTSKNGQKTSAVSTPKQMECTTSKHTKDKATSPRTESDVERKTSLESSCNSTEMSQVHSTPKEGAPYTIRSRQTRRILKIRQTSDSSTSYASPPVVKKGAYVAETNTSTPVLEMLDSSRNERKDKMRKSMVSPVSSPETPSPRTMRMASNIPRLTVQRRALFRANNKLHQAPRTTTREESAKADSERQQCDCENPSCKLFHGKMFKGQEEDKINEIFEELQKKSKGKIESLDELINKLRGLDPEQIVSIPSADSTSVNLQIAQDLMTGIEAVHEMLKKNLLESQKLVTNQQLELAPVVASTPLSSINDARGDAQPFAHLSFLKVPKLTSDLRFPTEQNVNNDKSTFHQPLNDNRDDTISRLINEILTQQTDDNNKPDSDDSSGKQIEMLTYNHQFSREDNVPTNGKNCLRKALHKDLSTIKELDTPDNTTGRGASSTGPPLAYKTLTSSSLNKKIPTPHTSTPTKLPPENKSTQVKVSDNSSPSSSSGSSNTESSNKATWSELSGFTGISGISKGGDSQNSIEKQLYEKVSWAGATVKKTRESAALDSSSTSEPLPQRSSLPKKHIDHMPGAHHEFSGLTDVSSISLRNANKSTEQSVLQKARTSTPNIQSSTMTDYSDIITTSPSIELT